MHFTESSLATSFYRSRWAVNFDLSEQGNMWFSTVKYTDYGGKMMTTLHFVWELDEEFEGIRDYQTLGNKLIEEGELPRWRSIPCTLQEDARRYELQLIPVNYIISLWKRGPWDEYTHLPSKVLDLCFSILQCPPDNIIQLISLLSWTTPQEVRDYHDKIQTQVQNKNRSEPARWRSHHLYKSNTKLKLEAMCRDLRIFK